MNPDRLLSLFDRIADAPDAVPRLRRFILDLAVRGKLVEQDPNDEPALELLKRIAAEKARLVKAGEIRKTSPASPISQNNAPFNLPIGWAWSTIGGICSKTGSGSTPRGGKAAYKPSGIVFLRSQNVYDDGLRLNDVAYIDSTIHERMSGTAVEKLDLLLNITGGSIGRCCLAPDDLGEANISQHVAIIRTAIDGPQHFLHCLILSPYFQAFIFGEQTGAGRGGLPKYKMDRIPVALPPLAEQHRIVAKVDELMALCDKLEAARAEREATRDRLAAASLAHLNEPDPDPATFRNHAAFALDNLSSLTTRVDQIKALRQTILNLAVRGKLVKQDPNDEPASELLKRIREWKLEATAQKQIRVPRRSLKPISDSEKPYLRPSGWEWAQLGEIIYIKSGDGLTAANMRCGDVPVFGGNGINGHHDTSNVDQPTIVIGRVGYYCGSIHVTPPKAWITDNAFITHFCQDAINLIFLVLLLNGTNLKEEENATAQPVISGSKIYPIIVGLPPLAEQHRIVAKVDELMAICDQLEVSLTAGDDTRCRLFDALLHATLTSASDQEITA